MKPHGTYKLAYRRRGSERPAADALAMDATPCTGEIDGLLERCARSELRCQRILDSLRSEIVEGAGAHSLRIRQVFTRPREIYRLELERPELGYQRTTFLDRDALEALLDADDVREAVESEPVEP
jgi:hypothetical protein